MTPDQWMALAQTIIMFLTGLALAWYTWETSKIRRETNRQNMLLAQQIDLAKGDQEYRRQSEMALLKPIFHTTKIVMSNGTNLYFEVHNKGNVARDIAIYPKDGLTGEMRPMRTAG